MKYSSIFAVTLVLSGCAGFAKLASYMPWHSANDVVSVAVFVHPSDTLNRAVKVDTIFVYDEVSKAVIDALAPQQWFAERAQFQANLSASIAVIKMEVVPATRQLAQTLPEDHKAAIAVYVFANNPGNKTQITQIKHALIELDEKSINVKSLPIKDGASS